VTLSIEEMERRAAVRRRNQALQAEAEAWDDLLNVWVGWTQQSHL
jgi:hypothetical protein